MTFDHLLTVYTVATFASAGLILAVYFMVKGKGI